MSNYKIGPQRLADGTVKLCIQAPNGKLYLSGEAQHNLRDLEETYNRFSIAFRNGDFEWTEFPADQEWAPNAGPKKGRMHNDERPIVDVKHADLVRFDGSPHKSVCPVCNEEGLRMRRDPETMMLISWDACYHCGQRVNYADVPHNKLSTLHGYTYPPLT